MSRFAWECRTEMNKMTRELEKRLGPDCSDLKMRFGKFHNNFVDLSFSFHRSLSLISIFVYLCFVFACCQSNIGLNSGPVTAGVLLGDRARFQLFGDTVNTGK